MRPAERDGGCRLEAQGDGCYRLSGDLGFQAAAGILARGSAAFAGRPSVHVDLSRLTDADSAGLAVLLEWVREALLDGRDIRFVRLPRRLADLARISGVAEFLPVGEEEADSG